MARPFIQPERAGEDIFRPPHGHPFRTASGTLKPWERVTFEGPPRPPKGLPARNVLPR